MKKLIYFCLLLIFALSSCEDPYKGTTYQVYETNPISTYLSTQDSLSEWVTILKYANLYGTINLSSTYYTAFVPTNAAVEAFYAEKGVSSIEDLGTDYAKALVKYHLMADTVDYDTFMEGGKLETETVSGDYLTVSFDTTDAESSGVNAVYLGDAHVSKFAIRTTNGFVYVLDAVMPPLVESAYQKVEANSDYSLFTEALDATTWKDSINTIYDTITSTSGAKTISQRSYTVFAVPDDVYAEAGITSLSDLATTLGAGSDYADTANAMFKYVAYHLLSGSYSLDELKTFDGSSDTTKYWTTLADSVFKISLETDGNYYINYKGGDGIRASFNDANSDVEAKNGVIHEVTGYMPICVIEDQSTVYFDLCDYPALETYINTYGTDGQVYQTLGTSEYRTKVSELSSVYTYELGGSGPASISSYNYIDYFTAKSTNNWASCYNADQLILNLGYLGWVSMKTPTLVKGKYKVTLNFDYATSQNFMRTSGGGKMVFTFDGGDSQETTPYFDVGTSVLGCYSTTLYDEIEFSSTGTHTMKIVIEDPAASTNTSFRIMLDYLLFEPIE